VAGLVIVIGVGLITAEITGNFWMGLAGSGLAAITPALIMTSRMALETNVALGLVTIGMWLLIKRRWFWGEICLLLSMYCYYTEWLLVPMLLIVITISQVKNIKKIILMTLIAVLAVIPLFNDYVKTAGPAARSKSEVLWHEANFENSNNNVGVVTKIGRIGGMFINNYLGYINPSYLFFSGLDLIGRDNPFTGGIFLWPTLIVLIAGMRTFWRKIKSKYKWLMAGWILISPVTAALTHGGPNLMRNLNTVVPLLVLAGIGMMEIGRRWRYATLGLLMMAGGMFWIKYNFIYPAEMAESMQGYRPIAEFSRTIESEAKTIYVDHRYGNYAGGHGIEYVGIPELYFGFYNKWQPEIMQNKVLSDEGIRYGRYVVTEIDWNNIGIRTDDYYIVPIGNLPTLKVEGKIGQVAVFDDASGKKAFEMWKGL